MLSVLHKSYNKTGAWNLIRAVEVKSRSKPIEIFNRNYHLTKNIRHVVVCPPTVVRYASTNTTDAFTKPIENIPEPPSIPLPDLSAVAEAASAEPSFVSLGLGGYSPIGLVQSAMEFLHISLDIPWWGAIMIGTLCVRLTIFPLVIMAQRNNAVMNNNLPEIQLLQLKMSQARQSGNQLDAARYAQEMMSFMKQKGLNPLKNMLVPLAQAPLFLSFFMGLRSMANCPVDSMTTGGVFWFTDLTVPDQFFLLPLITSATMYATIQLGTDGGRLDAQNMQMMKYVLKALPLVMIPFTINFPGAILVYWCSSNFISLMQVGFLRVPAVRDYFKIPKMVKHTPESLPIAKKGFIEGAKDSWTNMKITREMADRQRVDEIIFTRAGKGPLQKTYKFDPTKPIQTIQAKEK